MSKIFESRSQMPAEGGVKDHTMDAPLSSPWGGAPSPLTVHSVMTPADAKAIQRSQWPRNDWNDVVHVKNRGD